MNTDPRETLSSAPMSALQILAVAVTFGLTALDGFDVLSVSFAAPGIATEWGIDRAALGVVLSMELIGMAIGSILLGGVADRIGRRPTMLGCLILMTAGMFLVTTVRQIAELEVWRVMTGLGIGGLLAAGNAVAAEFSNFRRRNLSVSLMAIGYPVGAVIGGVIVAHLLRGHEWRAVFYFGGAITAVFIPLVYCFVPESIHWLAQKQPDSALAQINRTLRRMRHAAVSVLPAISAEVRKRSVADIFAPGLIALTVLATAAYFFHIMTFYFIVKWVPKIVVDMHFPPSSAANVLVWANVGGALGGVAVGILTQRTGVKPVTIAAMLLSTAMVTLFGRSAADLQQLSLLCACAGFCTNAGVVGLYAIFAQAFPTHVRATGTGFAIGVGRGGSVLGPITAGFLFKWGYDLPTVAQFMAMGSLIAAAILAMLKLKPDQPESMTLLSSVNN
ncbi:MAG: MFS transporter [Steroidobacteraceae bacterium]